MTWGLLSTIIQANAGLLSIRHKETYLNEILLKTTKQPPPKKKKQKKKTKPKNKPTNQTTKQNKQTYLSFTTLHLERS